MNKFVQFHVVLLNLIVLPTVCCADGAELTPGETEVRRHLSADEYEITTIRLWPDEAPDEPRRLSNQRCFRIA